MSLHADYQKLEPGDEIRLFEIDGSAFNMGDILYFHGYNIPHTEAEILAAGGDESKLPAKSIWWQGTEYKAWPCELEGIESSTSGSDAQPTLRVGNINGSISALCLYYDDLAQARVTIRETQKQYLDSRNFSEENSTADPTQEKRHLYFIDTKSLETDELVEFTLSSPMDLQGVLIPTRQYHSLCTWCIRNKYRSGDGCDYAGTRYFDKNNKPVDDPSKDICNGTLSACKLRFGDNNELPFGGFPGTSLIRS
ncbi:TPA: phage minor tail protein L [Klebsiella oxytoca]|uniref:Phage minor tail protein L n=1 Tax=Klebsiella pasteurii TaxID=2587529 RepID=A0A9Q9UI89_9ENTR|nr:MULTISPECIES: phage minor tail protein L [Klebsiella]MBW5930749.1 phage minor tail protein L [Klebsiella michiganensis]MBZ7251483.1 phage minor tail protein L [Klebsiella oxytoca]MBZ7447643.1 phage minor tail protein L [Klebsiella michiganensis]MBZ7472296.1 phage minor tail protein L [Klebsiella grimontii]MCW9441446.1 phage minor tail protein L [Klebsiella oxytoca]